MSLFITGTQRDLIRFTKDHPDGIHAEFDRNGPVGDKYKYCTQIAYNRALFGNINAEQPDSGNAEVARFKHYDNFGRLVYWYIKRHPGCTSAEINSDKIILRAHHRTGNKEVKNTVYQRLKTLRNNGDITTDESGHHWIA